jgi:hypothetical protein
MLQAIVLLPNCSFCPFSSTFFPLPSVSFLILHYPTLLHIHHLLTNLLYQLYTPQPPYNP